MVTKEKIKDLHYFISGKIAAADIQAAADKFLLEFGKTAKIAGFRTGHIPLSVLRQKYNGSAWGEALSRALDEDLTIYAREKKIHLAAQ